MKSELAPSGTLRVGMNGNNEALVVRGADGTLGGLSAELGRFIAAKLGIAYQPVLYESAAPFTASFRKDEWDIVLTGKNAVVAELLDFNADLFQVEYAYVAAPGRDFADTAAVDRAGVRIAVPRNASADVFLSRTLEAAELVRVDGNADAAIGMLAAGQADVYASSINSVDAIVKRMPGARIIGTFNTVVFAVAMQQGRSPEAQAQLAQWIAEAKAAGLVEKALEGAGAKGWRVLP